ncbi:MAG: hypothetical protein JWP01_3770 [Myxococcales bacterium]|nr:hypothetical protein [Myxococcales bacterium]
MLLATRRAMRLAHLLAASLLVSACADPADELDIDEVEVGEDDGGEGKADADSELRVRTGETTMWMTRELERRETPDGAVFAVRGRASRNVIDGMGFVIDDPYGDFAVRSARAFEVTWPASTARTLVDGVNQFVRTSFPPSAGRPDSLTSRIVVRPRFVSFGGASSVYLTAELTPVVLGGTVVYRAKGRTSSAMTGLSATVNGVAITYLRRTDSTHFEIDLAPDHAFAIAGATSTSAKLVITATVGTGTTVTKTARLGLAIKKLGITAGDAYDLWPRPTCTTAMQGCLASLPAGAVDLGSCGEAIEVLACGSQTGVTVDDVAFEAALADGAARTASAAFRSDTAGLVGAARVDAFAAGTLQTVEARLEPLFGGFYPSVAARTAALTSAVDRAIVDAYARPLDLVQPITPVAGNLAVTRQVAADALLRALATYDFLHGEFSRPYDELIAMYRAQHVASVREIRETGVLEEYSGHPEWQVFTGRWLSGPYIEITILRATGAAVNVLIEID